MAGSRPRVAIITRTKDRDVLLRRCVETILAQTYTNWIHVIVNDGGDPAIVENLIGKYLGPYAGRLKIIHNETSQGMEAASNIGIKNSESDYVVVLDDDDTWHPAFLDRMVAALGAPRWPNTKGVICHTEIVVERIENARIIEERRRDFNSWMKNIELLRLFAWNRFTPVSFLFERMVFEEIGYFDESLSVCGDWEFHLRFLTHYEIDLFPEILAYYHQRPNQTGVYGNTVHAASDEHADLRAYLSNQWIRDGIKKGRLGFGEIFIYSNLIEYHEKQSAKSGSAKSHLKQKLTQALRQLATGGKFWPRLNNLWMCRHAPRHRRDLEKE